MKHFVVIILTITTLTACGLLEKGDDPLPAGAFRGTAAIRGQTVPLPVDIATDIERITETGEVIRTAPPSSSNKNEPVVPESELKPMSPASNTVESPEVSSEVEHPLTKKKRFSASTGTDGNSIKYTIQKGDTLMKIAFEKYGNVYRWRDIYNSNRDVIKDYNLIYTNDILTIHGVQFVVVMKEGEPYIIRKGDTLKTIAKKLYGSEDRWKELAQNNPQLIRNPRKIFAGFTMYYRPSSSEQPTVPVRTPSNQEK